MSYKKEIAERTRLLIADGWTPMGNDLFYKDDLVSSRKSDQEMERLINDWENVVRSTVSPYGLPLKIDLPGVNAPDWIEEEGEPDEQ